LHAPRAFDSRHPGSERCRKTAQLQRDGSCIAGWERNTPVLSFAPLLQRDIVHGNTRFTEHDRDWLPRVQA